MIALENKEKTSMVYSKQRFAVVQSESASDYRIMLESQPLATPKGTVLKHESKALMESIAEEIIQTQEMSVKKLSLYSMLCTLVDFVKPHGESYFNKEIIARYLHQDMSLGALIDATSNHDWSDDDFCKSLSAFTPIQDFLKNSRIDMTFEPIIGAPEISEDEYFRSPNFQRLVDAVFSARALMSSEQLTVLTNSANVLGSTLPTILWLSGCISTPQLADLYSAYTSGGDQDSSLFSSMLVDNNDFDANREFIEPYTRLFERFLSNANTKN